MNTNNKLPVYVKVEEYKEVVEIISLIKTKINEAKNVLDKIYDIKKQEDKELELWGSQLEEVENKVNFVDNTLFEPGE